MKIRISTSDEEDNVDKRNPSGISSLLKDFNPEKKSPIKFF